MMETVLITGAARRLGSLIARNLSRSGCFVWIHYRTHRAEALALKKEILRDGGRAECIRADLRKTAQIDRMLDVISGSEYHELTTLINNASIFPGGTIRDTAVDVWDSVMDTNLRAVWYLSSVFVRKFPTAKRIISIGDASVNGGFAKHAAYGLSKFALKYLTEQMASAFAPEVRVNLLSPGLVLRGGSEPDELWKKMDRRTLLDNDDIVGSVLKGVDFLMSDPGMTGSELIVDNGLHIHAKK